MALPELGLDIDVDIVNTPSKTFIVDKNTNRVSNVDDGLISVAQAVDIALNAERFDWQIYGSDYGVELHDLINQDLDYIESELPRRIEDCFTDDDRILSCENFVFDKSEENLTVTFDIVTVFGTLNEEVAI